MNIFFTSDLHLFHDNIVDYCNRPCSKEEHNQYIIETLNSIIKPEDAVFNLGDLFYGRNASYTDKLNILKSLNGNWNHLLGNHDNENQLKQLCKDSNSNYLGMYHELVLSDCNFILFHYPIESWNNKFRGSVHLHGHTHNHSSRPIKNRFNMCFDVEFRPFSLDEILSWKDIDNLEGYNG
jgi:calcineurin-like phosphoesterase family protein